MRHVYSIGAALLAAVLFGAATPFAKQLLGEAPSTLLAGLLYLGSGCGLLAVRLIRDRGWQAVNLSHGEYRWLSGAILFGGVIAPVLLLIGLSHIAANTASLLLNLEAVFTALIAWWIFNENAGPRIVLGMLAIVAGGAVLAWPASTTNGSEATGALWIAAACACWAIDNNLTRKVSANDSVFLAGSKGLIAGVVNTTLALAMGAILPSWQIVSEAMTIGLLGYGISLVLFVLALRGLGTARTGAYFSIAPFIGALVAGFVFGEATPSIVWLAGALMGIGVVLHITEQHAHPHRHSAMFHEHPHTHDEHHQHLHEFPWDGKEPHTHPHLHQPMQHSHEHYPDIHHRHEH
jgi:drug/metabolite transporter (DMT)-like permease